MSDKARAGRVGLLRMELHAEAEILASREAVWNVITDFPGYASWNPVIPHAEGEARVGANLNVTIHWPGLKAGRYKLAVLAADPPRELRWLGRFVLPGLLDGNHAFTLESAGENRVRVMQSETFTGLLVPVFSYWLRHNILPGFTLMNEALKQRVEGQVDGMRSTDSEPTTRE